MLKSLNDPYTVYLTPKEVRDVEEKSKGVYSGIGASLQKTADGLVITTVFDGSPAKAAGLGPGDVIVTVDGKPTKGAAIETSIARIKGNEGTEVDAAAQAKGEGPPEQVTVVRKQHPDPRDARPDASTTRASRSATCSSSSSAACAGRDVRADVDTLAEEGRRLVHPRPALQPRRPARTRRST